MNKQEFIKKLEMQIRHANGCMDIDGTLKGFIKGLKFVRERFAEQLDEPSREECEIFGLSGCEVECLNCNHIFTAETLTFDEAYDPTDDGYESYTANFCPNCGAKIKKEKRDE